MRLTILGATSPVPGPGEANPGYLVETNGERWLLDCGSGVISRLQRYTPLSQLNGCLITHFHPDHMADLWTLSFGIGRLFLAGQREERFPIYVPPGYATVFWELTDRVGGFSSLFRSFLDLTEYRPHSTWLLGRTVAEFYPTGHPLAAHAIRLEGERSLCYSGDATLHGELVTAATHVDLLLCEAGAPDAAQAEETHHLTATMAAQVAAEAGVGELALTHFLSGEDRQAKVQEAARLFSGRCRAVREDDAIVLD